EREMKRVYPLIKVTGIKYDDPYDYLAGPIKIEISYTIPDFAIITSDEMIFTPVSVSGIFMRAMSHMYTDTDMDKREYPFRDRCSRLVELQENIKLPAKFTQVYFPEAESFSEASAGFEGRYQLSKSGNSLNVTERVVLNKRIYEPEDWDAYRRAVAAQQKFSKEPVILKFN
ncbi:MAG TPA: hypothetical protein VK994_08575, partial [Bacteroidales bacterium]|nr:hypothetical protein [Bacteroidales bacterium]